MNQRKKERKQEGEGGRKSRQVRFLRTQVSCSCHGRWGRKRYNRQCAGLLIQAFRGAHAIYLHSFHYSEMIPPHCLNRVPTHGIGNFVKLGSRCRPWGPFFVKRTRGIVILHSDSRWRQSCLAAYRPPKSVELSREPGALPGLQRLCELSLENGLMSAPNISDSFQGEIVPEKSETPKGKHTSGFVIQHN